MPNPSFVTAPRRSIRVSVQWMRLMKSARSSASPASSPAHQSASPKLTAYESENHRNVGKLPVAVILATLLHRELSPFAAFDDTP